MKHMERKGDDLKAQISRSFGDMALILDSKGIKEHDTLDAGEADTGEAQLLKRLKAMTAEGQICRAENELFDALEKNATPLLFKVTRMFYALLDGLTDERLEQCSFSRMEIRDGMWDAQALFMSGEDAVG